QTVADVIRRIEMGYRVLALKPIAKTLSLTLKMLQAANRAGIPCFCADLTVNPIQVEWNKNVAARLAPLPGFQYPMFETNGAQNYRRWAQLLAYHPCAGAEWLPLRQGFFELTEKFYQQSGGIFLPAPHYQQLVAPGMAG
ncbi:L-alanine-DL-glutamate epimerase, partial [candidate division KSB1 bacterium]|nr:L-alanine-DL-glutamate epimerase [candidate division KSB1 bacterium]